MTTPLEIRMRQERLYTIHTAQEVADGKRQVNEADLMNLDRYARWHFGARDFQQMVDENLEMVPKHPWEELVGAPQEGA